MDDRVVEISEKDNTGGEHHAQQETDRSILDIAGRDAGMRRDGIVDDLDRTVGDNVRDLFRQDRRNRVREGAGFLRIGGGDRHLEEAGGVHRLGIDHLAQLFIGIVHTAARDHQLHIRAGFENGHIGVDQVGGGRELTGGDGNGIAERERGVIDIEEGVGLVLRRHEEAGDTEEQSPKDDAGQENADDMLPQGRRNLNKIDIFRLFGIVLLLRHFSSSVSSGISFLPTS